MAVCARCGKNYEARFTCIIEEDEHFYVICDNCSAAYGLCAVCVHQGCTLRHDQVMEVVTQQLPNGSFARMQRLNPEKAKQQCKGCGCGNFPDCKLMNYSECGCSNFRMFR